MPLRIRLSHKINSIAAVGIAGVLALGGLFLFGSAAERDARLQDESARALGNSNARMQVAMLEQRRAEKNLMIRKEDKYLEEHRRGGKVAREVLTAMIAQTETAGLPDLTRDLKTIQAGYEDYDGHFGRIAGALAKLGLTEDAGLEGNLRKAVREIETTLSKLNEPGLVTAMLMMRRHEKDFMLRRDARYIAEMKKRAAQFSVELAASDLPAAAKADLAD
jgi:methyl-accepting chemotaxis protein